MPASNKPTLSKQHINLALICGDGLPISGLLTTFRNVLSLITHTPSCPPLIKLPIPADLGYSWRPDKAAFFPYGPKKTFYPPWLAVTDATPVFYPGYGEDLLRIRREVAQPGLLDEEQKLDLLERINAIMVPYQSHFENWFEKNDIDWVCAVNMTLSDAVPVTMALHRAAELRWGSGRPGGVLFWDHDLLSSYAVHEKNERVYPLTPNEFTRVPQAVPWHVWAIVSDVLLPETLLYPTDLRPLIIPNVLPVLPKHDVAIRGPNIFSKFLSGVGIFEGVLGGRPILLCPNRIFPVKGIENSIRVLAAIKEVTVKRGMAVPYLLIFGDPEEDAEYAAELELLAQDMRLTDDFRFLGGVPLGSGIKGTKAMLDEKDLLRLAAATHGSVVYTPNTTDVESVGLGPALASIAGLLCLVSRFNALDQVYGDGLNVVRLDLSRQNGFEVAAESFVDWMVASKKGSVPESQRRAWSEMMQQNKSLIRKKFPTRPWKDLLLRLAGEGGVNDDLILGAQEALGMVEGISPRM
ncbi:glycosyltransferase family 4 protein [Cadophora sp. DSE1049]|nr:glycosyltransferase family 4 protein [Cadophora sp. DSE1049]